MNRFKLPSTEKIESIIWMIVGLAVVLYICGLAIIFVLEPICPNGDCAPSTRRIVEPLQMVALAPTVPMTGVVAIGMLYWFLVVLVLPFRAAWNIASFVIQKSRAFLNHRANRADQADSIPAPPSKSR